MEPLTDRERAVLGRYLDIDPGGWRWYIVGMLAGAAVCLLGVLVLAASGEEAAVPFLGCVIVGLVVMEVSLDFRRSHTIASIIQKYHRAMKGRGEAE